MQENSEKTSIASDNTSIDSERQDFHQPLDCSHRDTSNPQERQWKQGQALPRRCPKERVRYRYPGYSGNNILITLPAAEGLLVGGPVEWRRRAERMFLAPSDFGRDFVSVKHLT